MTSCKNLGNSEDVVHSWSCNLRKSGMQWDWYRVEYRKGRGRFCGCCIGRCLGCFIIEKLLAMGSWMASLASHAMSFMSGFEKSTTYLGIQVIGCPWWMDADWWRSTRDLCCDGNWKVHFNPWWTNSHLSSTSRRFVPFFRAPKHPLFVLSLLRPLPAFRLDRVGRCSKKTARELNLLYNENRFWS